MRASNIMVAVLTDGRVIRWFSNFIKEAHQLGLKHGLYGGQEIGESADNLQKVTRASDLRLLATPRVAAMTSKGWFIRPELILTWWVEEK